MLEEKLNNLPSTPGVYQFKDSTGKVIYVGKAKILKNRVRQYFHTKPSYGRISAMVSKISDLELIQTDSEIEALILELNLIKELKPRYNVNLKDDKTYPYIVITNEPFPRIFPTRTKRTDGSKYFGPYTDVKTMRYALKSIRDIFQIRSCNLNLTEQSIKEKKFKICLDYHIHKCEGPCEGFISKETYNDTINHVSKLLNGKTASLVSELRNKMQEYSEKFMFEQAAKTRDKIESINVYTSRQKMITDDFIDRDVFAFEKEDNDGCAMVLKIRDGKVIGKTHYYVNNVIDEDESKILENIITNHYNKTDYIPEEIYTDKELENKELLEEWLRKTKTSKVEIIIPKIGEKAKLISMVKANARLMLEELKLAKIKKEFTVPSLEALKRDLNLKKSPKKIECFDISHIQGTDTVASMVVFTDAKPRKSEYRKFKIRSVSNETGTPDDFLSMREVIHRRYKRLLEENTPLPDLIIIDGGKGQLSSAVTVLQSIGIKISNDSSADISGSNKNSLSVIGLAKRLEEVYIPNISDPLNIPKTSSGLRLLQRIRDEAHRFAVTFHRSLRDKRTLTSELTAIPGIGEKTSIKLLTEFGSIESIKNLIESSPADIENISGKKTLNALKKYFEFNIDEL